MIKNRRTFAPNWWWYLFFFILTEIPVVQLCNKSPPKTIQSCGHCNQPCISTDKHTPRFSIVQRNDLCPYTDMCLRIDTGDICDHARLYKDARSTASIMVLHGYLICGGDGISVTGPGTSLDKYYVTFMSSRPRQNSRFFVDEIGNTIEISMKSNVSFDEIDSYEERGDTLNLDENNIDSNERKIDFDNKYPALPRNGYNLEIVAFYDKAFKDKCDQIRIDPHYVIDQIFILVDNFYQHDSLSTKFHVHLRKTIYKKDVKWNNAKSNATVDSLKKVNFYSEEEADIYAYLGSKYTDDTIRGTVPKVGICLNNGTCFGVCSKERYKRTFVAECDIDNLQLTAHIISHEIGHLLGMPHEFSKHKRTKLITPLYSWVYKESCKDVNSIMDYGSNENNLKWTNCSNEYLRIYHKEAKEVSTQNKFCLELHIHTTEVAFIPGNPLDMICDIGPCGGDKVHYVYWYLKDGTVIGNYSPSCKSAKCTVKEIEADYSDNIDVIYEEEKVKLRILTYISSLHLHSIYNNAYCEIVLEQTLYGCEIKQTFEIKMQVPAPPVWPTDAPPYTDVPTTQAPTTVEPETEAPPATVAPTTETPEEPDSGSDSPSGASEGPGNDPVVEAGLKNAGKNCWWKCGKQQGPCDWCGTGVCCRSGYYDTSNGCDGIIGHHRRHACVLPEECLIISNYNEEFGGISVDGEYRRLNERFFVKNDLSLIEGDTLMLIKALNGNAWSGCKGNIRSFENRNCPDGKRFAFFPDITKPKKGNVNVWSKKGDSSGTLKGKCGQHGQRATYQLEIGVHYGGLSIGNCGSYNTRDELEAACTADSNCVGYSTYTQNIGGTPENGFYPWCLKSTEDSKTVEATHNYYRKVVNSDGTECKSKDSQGTCKNINGQCWCYVRSGTSGYSVCGYSSGYSGTYYTIATDSEPSPHTIIESLGQRPHPGHCEYDSKGRCDADCATNVCDSNGCWGSSMRCWSNESRWGRTQSSIVRCTNMEY